jgi:hypothetical protein
MTIEYIRDKSDGVWNVIEGDEFLPVCEHCTKILCDFRCDILTGCDSFQKPSKKQEKDQ